MSKEEKQCFEIAMFWQRREVFSRFHRSCIPPLPFYQQFQHAELTPLYYLLTAILLPLLLIYWLVSLFIAITLLPYRLTNTYMSPFGLRGPGERNIQGVHHAFSRYFDLSLKHYISCVNGWVSVLYHGSDTRLDDYLDRALVTQGQLLGDSSDYMRRRVTAAREQLSKQLGYY